MIVLPAYQYESGQYKYTITLEKSKCSIEIAWNTRCHNFFMHFADGKGGEIKGVKIVENYPLLKNHRGLIDFDGDIMLLPSIVSPSPVTYDSFGFDWLLCYLSSDEVIVWENAHGIG